MDSLVPVKVALAASSVVVLLTVEATLDGGVDDALEGSGLTSLTAVIVPALLNTICVPVGCVGAAAPSRYAGSPMIDDYSYHLLANGSQKPLETRYKI
jgi:hypothetical protein